jgi:hypothetical protein
VLVGTPKGTEFYELGDPIKPFGPAADGTPEQ